MSDWWARAKGLESRHEAFASVDYKATQAQAAQENALCDWINKKLARFGKRGLVLRRRSTPGASDYEWSLFVATTGALVQADAEPRRIYSRLISLDLK